MTKKDKNTKNKVQVENIDDSNQEKGKVKSFLFDAVDNIKEGAKIFGKKTKKVATDTYETSAEFLGNTTDKVKGFTEKQKLQFKQHQIEKRQKELEAEFGEITIKHYVKEDNLHKPFLITKSVDKIVVEYKKNIKEINDLEKEIKKL